MIDVLVTIDDEPIDQKLYKRIITRSGIVGTLHQFMNATDALTFLDQSPQPRVDAILLDINMPGMNGFEFLEAATTRWGPNFARIAVMMLTTSAAPRDRERAAAFDVVKDYFVKPLTVEQLHTIDEYLNSDAAKSA